MNEVWKPVVGSDGRYEVSSLGNVRSHSACKKGENLSLSTDRKGYKNATLRFPGDSCGRTKGVNRLVCEAFNGPPPTEKHQAAHWDGNPANNVPDNLRWATPKENCNDKRRHGTHKIGSQIVSSKLTEETAESCLRRWNSGESITVLAEEHGVDDMVIWCLVVGKTWAHVAPEIPRRSESSAEIQPFACIRSTSHYKTTPRSGSFHLIDARGVAMCQGHVVETSTSTPLEKVPVNLRCQRCRPWPDTSTPS